MEIIVNSEKLELININDLVNYNIGFLCDHNKECYLIISETEETADFTHCYLIDKVGIQDFGNYNELLRGHKLKLVVDICSSLPEQPISLKINSGNVIISGVEI